MPELARLIANRLRQFVGSRRCAVRYTARFDINVLPLGQGANASSVAPSTKRLPSLQGHTRDVSATGLALIVPAIRIGDLYLTGEGHTLLVTLELPTGPVQLHVSSVRYERLDEKEDGYLIGVNIASMSDSDRTRYVDALRTIK